jgi:hypothetical protein
MNATWTAFIAAVPGGLAFGSGVIIRAGLYGFCFFDGNDSATSITR